MEIYRDTIDPLEEYFVEDVLIFRRYSLSSYSLKES